MHDKNTKLSNDEQITKSVSGIQFLNACYIINVTPSALKFIKINCILKEKSCKLLKKNITLGKTDIIYHM